MSMGFWPRISIERQHSFLDLSIHVGGPVDLCVVVWGFEILEVHDQRKDP